MRSVLAEPCHLTVLAFDRLLEMEWLEDVKATDERYHQAKLIAWAQWAPDELHREHAEWRAALLTPRMTPTSRETLEARALALLQRSRTWKKKAPAAGAH